MVTSWTEFESAQRSSLDFKLSSLNIQPSQLSFYFRFMFTIINPLSMHPTISIHIFSFPIFCSLFLDNIPINLPSLVPHSTTPSSSNNPSLQIDFLYIYFHHMSSRKQMNYLNVCLCTVHKEELLWMNYQKSIVRTDQHYRSKGSHICSSLGTHYVDMISVFNFFPPMQHPYAVF